MSAAVATVELKAPERSPSSTTAGLVMNPLAPLSRHSSIHKFSDEPAPKKRKIGESPPSGLTARTRSQENISLSAPTVSGNNSSCDSIDSKPPAIQNGATRIASSHNLVEESHGSSTEQTSLPGQENAILASLSSTEDTAKSQATATGTLSTANETSAPDASVMQETNTTSTLISPAIMPATAASSVATLAEAAPPLKATKMSHLRQKYTTELEYMLREFEKLERQLLGARKTEESSASRERREKLHSFIQHLADTIQQVERGCALEAAGQSTVSVSAAPQGTGDTALADPSQEKEEEENVQKLEEHILANLLPVKVRLKKQLAAQQGAKHNPATMPHRGGHGAPSKAPAGSTFADAARRQQEAVTRQEDVPVAAVPVAPDQTQFGKPLVQGSSLTKKLHGQTLGSRQRAHGDGVGATETQKSDKKTYVGGLAVGSSQMKSSFSAASNVHKLVIQEPSLVLQSQGAKEEDQTASLPDSDANIRHVSADTSPKPSASVQYTGPLSDNAYLSEEHRRKLRRKKKKKLRLKEQAKAVAAEKRELEKGRKKAKATKKSHRGPRHVEYLCALCNETYSSTCEYNPWWALAQHDCPKCRKRQVRHPS